MSESLKSLETIITKKQNHNSPVHSHLERSIRRNEKDTIEFLGVIFDILNDIQMRLTVLEKIELKKMD